MHVGLIGFGSIAQSLISLLPDCAVTVLVRERSLSRAHAVPMARTPDFVTSLEDLLATRPDVVVECAGHDAVRNMAAKILGQGTDLMIASLGSLADDRLHRSLTQAAFAGGANLIVPAGAIGGLDLLAAVASSGDAQVTYRGIKPPAAWKGSPAQDVVDLDALTTRRTFFRGTGRAAARAYPKNANVVAALALAGGGFDRMMVELVADPAVLVNTHSYTVRSPACDYTMTIENQPAPNNPRTSYTTVLSLHHEITKRINR